MYTHHTWLLVDDVISSCGVQQLEDQLDVGNIIVARNEAEIRVSIHLFCVTGLHILIIGK